jgi:2-haloacid dehalogenase
VLRATEHGPAQAVDLAASERWDFIASDFGDLATQLGC